MQPNLQWFDHQKKVLDETQDKNNVALYLEMGLGKSLLSCAIMERYNTPYNLCIVQKSKVQDFIDMFREQGFNVIDGTKSNAKVQPGVVVVNYESAWRRIQLNQFKCLNDFTMILDESSKIMHSKTKQTKFIMSLKPSHVILCSGSPCNGKYENLYTQAKLLGYPGSESLYWDSYVNWEQVDDKKMGYRRRFKKVYGYKNVPELKEFLRSHGAVFMRSEEVIKLPGSIDTDIRVPGIPQYRQFGQDRVTVTNDGTILVGDNPLTVMLRLRQLASQYNPHKVQALTDLLESCEERVIIFYNFQGEYDRIKEVCDKLDKPVSYVNGQGRDLTNYEKCPNSVTLIQFQSGSFGLNLQLANKTVYYSPPMGSDNYVQSRARTLRIGQNQTCYYWHIVQSDSIETRIYNNLKNGESYTLALFQEENPQYLTKKE